MSPLMLSEDGPGPSNNLDARGKHMRKPACGYQVPEMETPAQIDELYKRGNFAGDAPKPEPTNGRNDSTHAIDGYVNIYAGGYSCIWGDRHSAESARTTGGDMTDGDCRPESFIKTVRIGERHGDSMAAHVIGRATENIMLAKQQNKALWALLKTFTRELDDE